MAPLADLHVHLLAGLDDGPKTLDEALAMCKIMVDEGVRHTVAGAHQNDDYPNNTPERIRTAATGLANALKLDAIPLATHPCAEVMVSPELLDRLGRGELMTIGGKNRYILIEMPHGLCVDLQWMIEELVERDVRPILGHPERSPELLHEPGAMEKLIQAGCLVQVSTKSITRPPGSADATAIRSWFRRRMVHVLGSDGHSPTRRAPMMADAYKQVVRWVGEAEAERIGSGNGIAILEGRPIMIPAPEPPERHWFAKLFGG